MIRAIKVESPTSVLITCSSSEARRLRGILHARIGLDSDMFRSHGLYLGIEQTNVGDSTYRFEHKFDSSLTSESVKSRQQASVLKAFKDFTILVRDYLLNSDLDLISEDDRRRMLMIAFLRGRSLREQISILRIMRALI